MKKKHQISLLIWTLCAAAIQPALAEPKSFLIEDFENTTLSPTPSPTEWSNDSADDLDWTRNRGGTPSFQTGPSFDATTGTADGSYLYLETSAPTQNGDIAHLLSPILDLTNRAGTTVTFFYHMFGSTIGSLHVDASTDGGLTFTNDITAPLQGNQGNEWKPLTINLSQYDGVSEFRLRIRGVRGASFTGDIALDDFNFFETRSILFEDFESTTLSSTPSTTQWSNDTADDLDWTRNRGGTPSFQTGPSFDATTGNSEGWYVYLETSSPARNGDTAHLLTPVVNLTNRFNTTLTFSYHMYGSTIGSLHVDASTDGGSTFTNDIVSPLVGNQGNEWKPLTIDLSQYDGASDFRLRIRGVRGFSFTGDIAIDDFNLFASLPADLSVTMMASPDTVFVDTPLLYTLNVVNNGPFDATQVKVVNTLPPGVTFDAASPECNEVDAVVACEIGDLDSGDTTEINITVIPTMAGILSNHASVLADEPDPDLSDNEVTLQISVLTPAEAIDLVLGKIEALNLAGSINKGQTNAVNTKLDNALLWLERERPSKAISHLQALISQVTSLVAEGVLTETEAQPLIDTSNAIIDELAA